MKDIQLIYTENPEISRHLLVEVDKNADILKTLILEVLTIFPKLNGLNLEVTEMNTFNEKENKYVPIDENQKISSQLSQMDKIYFNLDLKEIWLNVEMILEEKDIKDNITNLYSIHFETINENNMDNIKDNIADIGLYLWECRTKGNNDENNEENNEPINQENLDYYLLDKISIEIKNNFNNKNLKEENDIRERKLRTKSVRINGKNGTGLNLNLNCKNINIFNKKSIEMTTMKSKSQENKKKGKDKKFGIDNKINCTLTFINFTNFIFDDEDDHLYNLNRKKKIFNTFFDDFYKEIILENNKKICVEKGKKIIFIQSEKENNENDDNDKNDSLKYYSMGDIPESPEEQKFSKKEKVIIDEIKKIDFDKKIKELNPYTFKPSFTRLYDRRNMRILPNNEILDSKDNNLDNKGKKELIDNNIIKINEQNLSINIGSDDNIVKKGILAAISIILFIIILFKLF